MDFGEIFEAKYNDYNNYDIKYYEDFYNDYNKERSNNERKRSKRIQST